MKRSTYFLIFAATATFFSIACGGAGNSTNVVTNAPANNAHPTPIPSATLDELASGREVYKANCAKCHTENGTGGEVIIEGKKLDADDLTAAEVKRFPDEKIIRIIMNGVEDDGMP